MPNESVHLAEAFSKNASLTRQNEIDLFHYQSLSRLLVKLDGYLDIERGTREGQKRDLELIRLHGK